MALENISNPTCGSLAFHSCAVDCHCWRRVERISGSRSSGTKVDSDVAQPILSGVDCRTGDGEREVNWGTSRWFQGAGLRS